MLPWRTVVKARVLSVALSIEKRVLDKHVLTAEPTRTGWELVGFAIAIVGLIVSLGVPGVWGAALGLTSRGLGSR